jgi:hypothetical protein
MSRRIRRLAGWALLAGLTGCSSQPAQPPLAEVEGTVTWKGRPLAQVRVEFVPDYYSGVKGPRSTAETDAQGHFTLTADDGRPGAVPGRHKVVVTWDPSWRQRQENPTVEAPPVPAGAGQALRQELTREVKEGKQTLDLPLK